ncbi:MAG: YdcF family protein [Anaerolineae bacterium]|nr:YdcF family protein [Anaerolineae bacterium]
MSGDLNHSHPRWRRSAIRLLNGLIVLGLIIAVPLAITIVRYSQQDGAAPADAIVMLGAGIDDDGTASDAQIRRAQHAAALYHAGYAANIICTGGIAYDRPRSEAAVCADLLVEEGVPRDAIWLDEISLSTEENAIESARIMREHGWVSALVASDDLHLWRAHLLFTRYVDVVMTSPAQATTGPTPPLEYLRILFREMAAMVWLAFKDALGLPFTRV